MKGKVGIGERRMVIGHCLTHRLVTRFPPSIQETLTGAWKTALGNGCGNCVCFHPEFAPLPEIMEETVTEAELEAFDEAWFAIQQTLTEEEARLRRQASLTRVDVGRALLKCKYSLWLQFWTPRLKKSRKNKRGRELERCRKAAEAEAAGGSVPSPGPKPPKRLFENEAVLTAAAGTSDLQRELDRVRGRSMARCSDRASRSKSAGHPPAAGGAAAAMPELEGEAIRKVLFLDEAEVSRRREQKRRELIHQHENPRRPIPLLDLDVKMQSELNVKVRQEKWSKSLHRPAGQSETAESGRTVHLIPVGAESTHRQQQQGARPKQIAVSIFPDCQPSNASAHDATNTAGAADNTVNATGTANATTFLRGVGRGLGNRFLLPRGYETLAWEEKQIWDERAKVLLKRVLPQLAPGFRPNLQAWRKAPDNWPRAGQTNEDALHDWLKFEKQARADEQFADTKPPARRSTVVQDYTRKLEERFANCRWRVFLPDGFYGRDEEDIPPWMQRWCQLLMETVRESECPEPYEGRLSAEDWSRDFHLFKARKQVRLGKSEEEEAQRTKDRNRLQCTQKSSEILIPDVVAGCLIPHDFEAAARRAYMALGIHDGVTRDYRETEREMWNQYWWLKGIGELGDRLPLKEFITVRRPTREEVQRFQADWKWEMAHANDRDPYVPVKVNKNGETVTLSNAPKHQEWGTQQDQAIAQTLSTVGPPNVSTGRFQDRSTTAPPGIAMKPELEPMEDFEEEQ